MSMTSISLDEAEKQALAKIDAALASRAQLPADSQHWHNPENIKNEAKKLFAAIRMVGDIFPSSVALADFLVETRAKRMAEIDGKEQDDLLLPHNAEDPTDTRRYYRACRSEYRLAFESVVSSLQISSQVQEVERHASTGALAAR